jgi:hypothetical protein
MFEGAERKLSLAEYFLNNLKALAKEAGGFSYIRVDKRNEMSANLDGFLFEVISAKDFFLQGVSKHYGLQFDKKQDTPDTSQILQRLRAKDDVSLNNVIEVVDALHRRWTKRGRWLWRLSNYRNAATHRELIHFGHEAKVKITVDKGEFKKMQELAVEDKLKVKLITEQDKSKLGHSAIARRIEGVAVKTYLFKDPEDPSQGNVEVEVIPYCEQSLDKVRRLLENLYSHLEI